MSNVVNIKTVPCKTSTMRYRGFTVTITYVVATQEWEWEFAQEICIKHSNRASSLDKARKAAEKKIDALL